MRNLTCVTPGQFAFQESQPQSQGKDEVRVQIERIGICGTDIHAFRGNQAFFSYPRILGHELSGIIVDASDSDESIQPGQHVVIIPYLHCGQCTACINGRTNCCTDLNVLGVHCDGGMQDTITVPRSNLISDKDLSLELLSVIEPYCVAWHAVKRANIVPNSWVAVQGCGPIGFAIAQLLSMKGHKIIILEQPGNRMIKAEKSLEAKHVISANDNPISAIKEITSGDMVQYLFDATGSKKAIESGPDFLGPGGKFILVGIWNGKIAFHQPDLHRKELSVLSSRNATKDEFYEVMDFMKQGKINTASYISEVIPSIQAPEMFQVLAHENHDYMKVVIQWPK